MKVRGGFRIRDGYGIGRDIVAPKNLELCGQNLKKKETKVQNHRVANSHGRTNTIEMLNISKVANSEALVILDHMEIFLNTCMPNKWDGGQNLMD